MLTVSGSANFSGVLSAVQAVPPTGPVEIDFTAATFIEPSGIAAAASLIDMLVRDGRQVTFREPSDPGVRNYLSRMKVGQFLDTFNVPHSLPTVHANPLASDLLELTQFNSSGTGAGDLLGALVQGKLEQSNVDPMVIDGLYGAISELVGNVEFHAGVPFGYLAAQTTHQGTRIKFAIADCGKGMKASLEEQYHPVDDANAIALAVQSNVSSTGEVGRGQGLPDVVANATGLQGTVFLASGNASTNYFANSSQATRRAVSFPGTLLQVELPCTPV